MIKWKRVGIDLSVVAAAAFILLIVLPAPYHYSELQDDDNYCIYEDYNWNGTEVHNNSEWNHYVVPGCPGAAVESAIYMVAGILVTIIALMIGITRYTDLLPKKGEPDES